MNDEEDHGARGYGRGTRTDGGHLVSRSQAAGAATATASASAVAVAVAVSTNRVFSEGFGGGSGVGGCGCGGAAVFFRAAVAVAARGGGVGGRRRQRDPLGPLRLVDPPSQESEKDPAERGAFLFLCAGLLGGQFSPRTLPSTTAGYCVGDVGGERRVGATWH